MKMILLAASALALGGMAQAQDATQPPPAAAPANSTMAPPAAPADPSTAAPTAMPADPAAAAPAAAPAAPADATAAAGSTDDSNLPKCSKTVTDKCVQGAGGGHAKMHHKKK